MLTICETEVLEPPPGDWDTLLMPYTGPKVCVSPKKIVKDILTLSSGLADPISSSQQAPSQTCRGANDDDKVDDNNDKEACCHQTCISDDDNPQNRISTHLCWMKL
jgi:hypothetical protein